jgi:hypothetical protein
LWQVNGKLIAWRVFWSAERGSLIYIAFFNATKANISGGLGGQLKKIYKKKYRGGVASWRFVIYQWF